MEHLANAGEAGREIRLSGGQCKHILGSSDLLLYERPSQHIFQITDNSKITLRRRGRNAQPTRRNRPILPQLADNDNTNTLPPLLGILAPALRHMQSERHHVIP